MKVTRLPEPGSALCEFEYHLYKFHWGCRRLYIDLLDEVLHKHNIGAAASKHHANCQDCLAVHDDNDLLIDSGELLLENYIPKI